ncbi:Pol polyprotein [Plakobranchus ocellatus]|uniref:Pol polyprotein n=1 Tax=Plakobranchus ocellatus TaxID=259542 RepID=A0AAV4DRM7_9GAST|nr:Pol polyprotein [Plakobranchus ocellatus]
MSARRVGCQINTPLAGTILVEPRNGHDLIIPWVICKDQDSIVTLLCNWTTREITVPENTCVGTACELSEDGLNQEADHVYERNPVIRSCQVTPDLPSHLEPLWLDSKTELDDQQAESLRSLLAEYQDVFAKSDFDLGNFTAVYHRVDTGQAAPIKQRMRRTPIHFKGEEDAHLDKMLEAGVLQLSVSEWASPSVLVRKLDGSVRWCVDYRALNKITRRDVFPLPRIEDCVDALDGNLWFSKLGANSAYWQVRLDEESKPKTAFCTRRGLFEFVRMPFGLCMQRACYLLESNQSGSLGSELGVSPRAFGRCVRTRQEL